MVEKLFQAFAFKRVNVLYRYVSAKEMATTGSEREAFKIDYILLPSGFMDQYYMALTKAGLYKLNPVYP